MIKKIEYEAFTPKGNVSYLNQLLLMSRKNRKNPTKAEEKNMERNINEKKNRL